MRERAAGLALVLAFGCATAGDESGGGAPDDATPREQVDAAMSGRPDAGLADARGSIDAVEIETPDAASLTFDAPPPPPPDARPPGMPDAAPCTPTWRNLLVNSSFDSGPGAPWMESSSGGFPLVTNDFSPNVITANTPAYGAWLGGFDGADDDLYQQVVVPPTATALRVRGVRLIGTADSTSVPFDYLYLRLRNSAGSVIETMATFSNVDTVASWTAFSASAASAHPGETVQLLIKATTDFWPDSHTNFFVDSLALEALTCP